MKTNSDKLKTHIRHMFSQCREERFYLKNAFLPDCIYICSTKYHLKCRRGAPACAPSEQTSAYRQVAHMGATLRLIAKNIKSIIIQSGTNISIVQFVSPRPKLSIVHCQLSIESKSGTNVFFKQNLSSKPKLQTKTSLHIDIIALMS